MYPPTIIFEINNPSKIFFLRLFADTHVATGTIMDQLAEEDVLTHYEPEGKCEVRSISVAVQEMLT